MLQSELQEILAKHKAWLDGEEGGKRADLRGANLCGVDLYGADLRGANLRSTNLYGAELYGADLRGVNLDFSCWPLWCGSFDITVDKRIAAQFAYHFCRLKCDESEVFEYQKAIANLANQFHRVDECGKIKF